MSSRKIWDCKRGGSGDSGISRRAQNHAEMAMVTAAQSRGC